MKNLSYFDAYMRGERSRDYRNRQWISQYGQYSQYVRQLMGLYTVTLPPNITIRGQGFRSTYMRTS